MEETENGFFASNRPGGKGDDDIYFFSKPVVEEVDSTILAEPRTTPPTR